MLAPLLRALGNLSAPALRRVVGLSLALAAASFAVLWAAVAIALAYSPSFGWHLLDWIADLLGAAAVLGLTWLCFPAVMTVVMSIFLDRVAGAVEALDYPGQGPPRRQSLSEATMTTLRLMGLTLLLNLLALPVYILAPGINFFVFLGLNGYLFGREYFEVVALRRLDRDAARALRHRFAGQVMVAGVAIVGLFAVPLLNLVAPVIATAFMVHLFQGLRHRAPHPLLS